MKRHPSAGGEPGTRAPGGRERGGARPTRGLVPFHGVTAHHYKPRRLDRTRRSPGPIRLGGGIDRGRIMSRPPRRADEPVGRRTFRAREERMGANGDGRLGGRHMDSWRIEGVLGRGVRLAGFGHSPGLPAGRHLRCHLGLDLPRRPGPTPSGAPRRAPRGRRGRAGPAARAADQRGLRALVGGPQALGRDRQPDAQPRHPGGSPTARTTPGGARTSVRWTIAFAHASRRSLRGERDPRGRVPAGEEDAGESPGACTPD